MQYIFILGNTPKLSILELKSVLADFEIIKQTDQIFWIETSQQLDTKKFIDQLGGTIKIGSMIGEGKIDDYNAWQKIMPSIFSNFENTNKKIKFGFSLHNLNSDISGKKLKQIKLNYKKSGLAYKKELKQEGIRSEVIESKDLALSSVIVTKEKCIDLLTIIDKDKIYYGHTQAVQDYKDFSNRDYGRPSRDPKSGMLPPKVARMMVNIAKGNQQETLLDPFCGSGTVLQEALLLGYKNVIGSDLSDKAIADTKANLEHLNLTNFNLLNLDARNLHKNLEPNSISTIVTEVYLGPHDINIDKLNFTIKDLSSLYEAVFSKLKNILKPEATLVIAFPAWRFQNKITHLPIGPKLKELGYKQKTDPIIYGRPDSKVLREIYVLTI